MSLQFYARLSCNTPGCQTGVGDPPKPLKTLMAARETIWSAAEREGWTTDGKRHFCPLCRDYLAKAANGGKVQPEAMAEWLAASIASAAHYDKTAGDWPL